METENLYNDILGMLSIIKDDKNKLTKVLTCIENEVLDQDMNPKEVRLPEKYKEILDQVAEEMDAGFVTFFNPDTLELEVMTNPDLYSREVYGEQHEDRLDDFEMSYYNWDRMVKFEPFSNNEIYSMMEDFVNELDNEKLASILENGLANPKSTEIFTRIIESSDHRQQWVDFRRKRTKDYVRNRLLQEVPQEINYENV